MKKLLLITLLTFFTINTSLIMPKRLESNNGVIPEYSGGRFGDNLLALANTLYFSLKNKCELFLVPFEYSDQLTLDTVLPKHSPQAESRFQRKMYHLDPTVKIEFKIPGTSQPLTDTLFVLPYFPYLDGIEYAGCKFYSFFVNWQESVFKEKLRELIQPKKQLALITPPSNGISIAVHVRKGGNFDVWDDQARTDLAGVAYRSPLDQYYIDQIKTIATLFEGLPLYVFLFTDDPKPQELVDSYRKQLGIAAITLDYRKEENHDKKNVLEDFFSLQNFDILIRPHSNFSIMAEQLGNHSIVISPGSFLLDSSVQSGNIRFNGNVKEITERFYKKCFSSDLEF